MNKELIINVTASEITIALFEDKQLVELTKEQSRSGYAVGDIYMGKVKKIMPGLNAAFVNVGHEKDGFIHYLDLGPQFTSLQKMVNILTNNKRSINFEGLKLEKPLGKSGKIASHIASGQTILVQVAKEAISTKGPRLTSDISLAGRNVVLIPFSGKISISQKIRSNEERNRLKKIASGVLPNNYGVIIRTAAAGHPAEDVEQDILALVHKWEKAMENLKQQNAPSLVLGEMNRTTTMIRDLLNGSFSNIYIDDQATYEEVRDYIRTIVPEKGEDRKTIQGQRSYFSTTSTCRSRSCPSLRSMYRCARVPT